ncbi:MAG TPA: alpha/beta fold hydrolase [Caldimonas sp.]|nr:alpha/beta fold hydrolase [Caldimonas sp.]
MWVEVRGKKLAVEKQGSGDAVVLVHGLGSTANVWEPQVRALADRFTMLRYDLEGAGRSAYEGPLSIDGWVQDLKALLDVERIDKARLVGHSLGTLILQHFAVAYPARVDRLVFIGVNRAPPEARRQAVRERVAKVRAEGLDAIVETVVKGGVSPHTLAHKPEVVGFVRELLTRQPTEGYARCCEAMASSVAADVAAVKAPVLLIAGRDDGVSPPANSEGMAKDLPNAQLRILEQCGHWHPIEQPAAVSQALREFL